jgi:hypothetical protein
MTAHPLRIRGKDEGTKPVCVELRGKLDNSARNSPGCNVAIQVQWTSGSIEEYYILAANIASLLAWIVTALKEPPEKGLSFSKARMQDTLLTEDSSWSDEAQELSFHIASDDVQGQDLEERIGTCWHQLFTGLNIAVGFPIPARPAGMHGVEVPFFLMTSFASFGYPVAYKGGFVLKGWQNALFPVRTDSDLGLTNQASALQWHLFGSTRPRLYMAEAKDKAPELRPIETKLSSTEFCIAIEQTKRHFLWLYQDTRTCIGTNSSQADVVMPIRISSDLRERNLRSLGEWSRTVSVSLGLGTHGVSSGASTSFQIRKRKEREMRLNLETIRRQVINATKSNSTLLYDVQTKIAWMLPQIFVVMHLVQAWTKVNYPGIQISYPVFDDMKPESLEEALQQFFLQSTATEVHMELETVFTNFAKALDQLQDDEELKPAKRPNIMQLSGVDFAQLALLPRTYSILTKNINLQSSGDWLKMLKCNWKDLQVAKGPYRVVTLFCNNLTTKPILPNCGVCSTWYPPPIGQDYLITIMHCVKRLAERNGSDPVKLSPKHGWEYGMYRPFERCSGRSCNRLQKIVEGTVDRSTADTLKEASDHAALVFGGAFSVNAHLECRLIPLLAPDQQQAAVPIITAVDLATRIGAATAGTVTTNVADPQLVQEQQQTAQLPSRRRPPPPPPPRRVRQPAQAQQEPGTI